MSGRLYSVVKWARRLIESYENKSFSFLIGLLGLTAIILTRNYLESAFEDEQILGFHCLPVPSALAFFNHYYLFYVGFFIWIVLILRWMSGEKVEKVARLVVASFVVILVAPVIDIVVSHGVGYKMRYAMEIGAVKSAYLLWNFWRELPWISWGQRIEILLAAVGLVGYALIKRRGYLRALAGTGSFWLLTIVFGALPLFLTKASLLIWKDQGEIAVFTGGLTSSNRNYAFICLVYIVVGGWILLRKFDSRASQRIKNALLTRESLVFGLIALGGLIYGYYGYKGSYPFVFSNILNYLAGISVIAVFPLTLLSIRLRPYFRKRRKPWLSFVLWLTAFYLALNVGFVALLLQIGFTVVYLFWRPAKFRAAFYLILSISSFCGGFSLFAQNYTFISLSPWAGERRSARGHNLAGREYFLRREFPLAIREYQAAMVAGCKDYRLHLRLAQSYQLMGFTPNALEELDNAMRLNPRDSEPYLVMGSILRSEGELMEARRVFELAIRRRVEPGEFFLEKARIEIETDELVGAESCLKHALHLAAPRKKYWELKAMLAAKEGKYSEALKMYDQLLRLDRKSALAHREKGLIYHSMGRYSDAKSEYEESLKLKPRNAMVHNNLGVVLFNLGRLEEADRQFREALVINPELAEGYYNRGRVYEERAMFEESRMMYLRALRADSTYQPAVEALKEPGER